MTATQTLLRNVVRFPRALRAAGAHVPGGVARDLVEVLSLIDLGRRDDVAAAMRAVCIRRHEDFPIFDATFRAFFHSTPAARERDSAAAGDHDSEGADRHEELSPDPTLHESSEASPAGSESAPLVSAAAASPEESLRRKDFATFSERELADARALMATLRWRPDERRTPRWRRSARGRIDVQRWLRTSHRHGGDVVEWPRQTRGMAQRPLIVLCDISGSMQRYSRMLIHFAHTIARRQPRVDVFVFATRLARVTRYTNHRLSDALVRALPRVAPDWAGGTRIGDALQTFNRRFGQRALRRRPVVLLISDGWDRGDPAVLSKHMERLQRSSARLVWLNPLLGAPDYEPLTRGIVAARPFVDDFLPAHNIDSLVSLARILNQLQAPERRRTRPSRSHV